MNETINLIEDIVPITEFNKGRAGKIFETVKKDGRAKIVLKNNSPECVLLPPVYYQSLMDKLEDLYLLALANERLTNLDEKKLISSDEINRKFNFCPDDGDLDEDEIE